MAENILAFFGHHKCASTYIDRVVGNIGGYLGMRVRTEYLPQVLPNGYHSTEPYSARLRELLHSLETSEYDFLCHGNADAPLLECLSKRGYRGFHVIRDPRDIAVSGFFSHRYSHPAKADLNPWLVDHRERLMQIDDDEEGLLLEVDYCRTYFERLARWDYSNPWVYETRLEKLTANPEEEFQKALQFIGINVVDGHPVSFAAITLNKLSQKLFGAAMRRSQALPRFYFQRILRRASFKRSAKGRERGQENRKSHLRKGISGDWKNYFTPKVKERFKELYGQLLIDLEYETGFNC